MYNDETLKLQTPELLLTFDLNPYQYDQNSKERYSLSVSLDPKINGVKDLESIIETIDSTCQNTFKGELPTDAQFISSIKQSKNNAFPPVLRCKMVSNNTRFKCSISENGSAIDDQISSVKNKLKKGTRVQLVIQLNPVWNVKKKYGVSWQVMAIDIKKPVVNFRKCVN